MEWWLNLSAAFSMQFGGGHCNIKACHDAYGPSCCLLLSLKSKCFLTKVLYKLFVLSVLVTRSIHHTASYILWSSHYMKCRLCGLAILQFYQVINVTPTHVNSDRVQVLSDSAALYCQPSPLPLARGLKNSAIVCKTETLVFK